MSSQSSCVSHDHVIAHHAVVSDMSEGHQQAVATDHGLTTGGSTFVDGSRLADGSTVANIAIGGLTLVFQILRNSRTLIICVIVLILPSFLVSHIHPAQSMHYE